MVARDRGTPRRSWATAVVALLVVAALAVTAMVVLRGSQERAQARAAAAVYTPPPLAKPSVSAPLVGPKSGVPLTIIGDDFTVQDASSSAQYWPEIAAGSAKVRATIYADSGAGYLAEPEDGEGAFPASAAQIDSSAKAVILFGGANDAGASTLSVYRAATSTISAAQTSAPKATVVIVGPAWPQGSVPAGVSRIRDLLKAAAALAHVKFVDPLAEHWLAASDAVNPNGATLTPRGQEAVAKHMRSVLRSAAH